MVDWKNIDAAKLRDSLWKIEQDLVEQVDPQRMESCLTGACQSLQQQDKGQGR